jgi:hypothetical protein
MDMSAANDGSSNVSVIEINDFEAEYYSGDIVIVKVVPIKSNL